MREGEKNRERETEVAWERRRRVREREAVRDCVRESVERDTGERLLFLV